MAGTIKIVASTIPEEHIIPSLIAEFQKKHPDVRFKIKAQDSITSLQSLQANDADFAAVGTILGYEEKFDAIQIGEEELVLIVPCNHELANHKSVKLNEIKKYPFINREETSGTRKEIEKMFENNSISISQLKLGIGVGKHRISNNSRFRRKRNKCNFFNRCEKSPSSRLSKNNQN